MNRNKGPGWFLKNLSQLLRTRFNANGINYAFCIFDVNSSTSSTSSISGRVFSLDAANKHAITTHRQNIDTITEMISKILNIIAHHLHVFKIKSCNDFMKRGFAAQFGETPPPNLHSLLLSAAKTVQKDKIFYQLQLFHIVMEFSMFRLLNIMKNIS